MFTIPDKDEGLNNLQSVWFQEYIDILVAGVGSKDAVISGCAVSPSAGMTLAVAAGSVNSAGLLYTVAAANPVIGAAHATYARLDFVVVTSAGAVAVRAGTAALNPKPPAKTAGDVVLAVVYVPALSTTVGANQIVDMKVGVSSKLAAIVNGSMGAFGHRNKIINGDMRVGQRGSVVFSASGSQYGWVDRWLVTISGTTVSGLGYQDSASPTESGYALQIGNVVTTGATIVGAAQRIESFNSVPLNSKTITVTGKVYQSTGAPQTLTLGINKATTKDNFGGQTLIGSTAQVIPNATWTAFSYTLTLGSTDASNGLQLSMNYEALGAMSTSQFLFGDIQLEEGSEAQSFEHRPIGTELALCQRYYAADTSNGSIFSGNVTSGSEYYASTQFPVAMRAAPTIALTNITASGFSTTVGATGASALGFREARTSDATTAGGFFRSGWTASAEL